MSLSIRIQKSVALLAWCALAVAVSWRLGRSIMQWDEVGLIPLLQCLALGLAVWIVLQPAVGLYLFVVVSFLMPRLCDLGWLPRSALWLNDLVLVCWGVHVAIRSLGRQQLPKTPFDLLALLLVTLFALSAVANQLAPMQVLVGLRYYFKYPVAFYLMVAIRFPPATLRRVLLLVVLLALAQVPVTAYQFIRLGGPHDHVSGTLNLHGSGEMLFWQLAAASFLIGAYFSGVISARVATLAGLTLVPPLLGQVQATLLYFPLVMVALAVPLLLTRNLRLARRYVMAAVLLPVVVGSLGYFVSPRLRERVLRANTAYLGSVEDAIEYGQMGNQGRLATLEAAWKLAGLRPTAFWLGYGPGMAGDSAYAVASLKQRGGLQMAATQLDFLIVDMGIPAIALTLAVVALAYGVNLRASRRARSRPDRAITFAMFGVIPLYAGNFIYLPCWIADVTAFIFWLGVAYVVPISQQRLPMPRLIGLGRDRVFGSTRDCLIALEGRKRSDAEPVGVAGGAGGVWSARGGAEVRP